MTDQKIDLAEIPKSSREVIRLTVERDHGRTILGLRVWFRAKDGSMRPGSDGMVLTSDVAALVAKEMLKAADDKL